MSGLFNSGVRDFCGDESAISKLSNHFSKDYSLKQEGLNQNSQPTSQQYIPSTFNLNELFKNVVESNKEIAFNNVEQKNNETLFTGTTNSQFFIKSNDRSEQVFNSSFITPTYFTIPQSQFCPPNQDLVAHEWARHELSQFDDSIITEDDLKALSMSNESRQEGLRFSDIIRNMTLEDERQDIDVLKDNLKNANDEFLYDLDKDLREMREKLVYNDESLDMWPQLNNNSSNILKEFLFIKDNHYAESLKNNHGHQNEKADEMLERGKKMYKEGYFCEAMLIFEAVVQVKPASEEAWHYLALSLSENEQDNRAMVACKKCLSINKVDGEVLLSLARIHCNEMNIVSTISCLERWLLSNPKYSDLATVGQEAIQNSVDADDSMWQTIFEDAFESRGQFGIIEQQLNAAKERNGENIDPEVETALGTLYHVIQDYQKATAHFEKAASATSNNALLWNKLGTSYCNSGEFDKAISTYQRALELAPGFVRAECNLGVSFYNMGNYSEAIRHALRAHKLQHLSKSNGSQTSMSVTESMGSEVETDPIWTLIRMSCFKMDRPDLDLVVFSRDVDTLGREFDV